MVYRYIGGILLKLTPGFIIGTLLVTLIGIPVLFNFVLLLGTGLAKGNMSDWFTFYGNIFGGLIGGFFTFGALLLTFKKEKKDMKPQIDIPHQGIEFIDDGKGTDSFIPIAIELINIGGGIAKNIECNLELSNYEDVLEYLERNSKSMNISVTKHDPLDLGEMYSELKGTFRIYGKLDGVNNVMGEYREKYESSFWGSCLPITVNQEAKVNFVLHRGLRNWINYIGRDRTSYHQPKKVLFNFKLEVAYESGNGEKTTDFFKLKWEDGGIRLEEDKIKQQYILRSEKLK